MRRIAVFCLISLALTGCANQGLRDIRSDGAGPDEFLIQPVKPLEAPDDFSSLPVPTPGQANLTDRSAVAEGVAAFGGRQDSGTAIPASDGALVQYASRLGVQAGIRTSLAETDAEFRQRKARFTQYRLVAVDRYNQAYKRETLDPHNEAARWRRAGARTPSSPPNPARYR